MNKIIELLPTIIVVIRYIRYFEFLRTRDDFIGIIPFSSNFQYSSTLQLMKTFPLMVLNCNY